MGWLTVAESFSINGTDIASLVESIQLKRGLVGLPPMRGGDYELPGREGADPGARWAGPRIVTIGGVLYGRDGTTLVPTDARARYLDKTRALAAAVYAGGLDATYTRVIPRASGGDLTTVASGRYLSGLESIEQAAFHAGRFAFDLYLYDAFWHASSDTTLSTITTTATPTIAGDVPTRRITLTFSGVTATQRLTNSTTGEWVEVVGSSGAATVLDCEEFTATRSGGSVAGLVAHNASFDSWLSLAAGSNSLALTGGGQVIVAYRGAYA